MLLPRETMEIFLECWLGRFLGVCLIDREGLGLERREAYEEEPFW